MESVVHGRAASGADGANGSRWRSMDRRRDTCCRGSCVSCRAATSSARLAITTSSRRSTASKSATRSIRRAGSAAVSTRPASSCCSSTHSTQLGCKVVGLRTDNFNFTSQRAIEALGAKKGRGVAPSCGAPRRLGARHRDVQHPRERMAGCAQAPRAATCAPREMSGIVCGHEPDNPFSSSRLVARSTRRTSMRSANTRFARA